MNVRHDPIARVQPRAVVPVERPPTIIAFAAEEPEIRAGLASDVAEAAVGEVAGELQHAYPIDPVVVAERPTCGSLVAW
jgi:hypothetical protein